MNYATVNDVKLYLGVETLTTFETSRINFFLDKTKDVLNNIMGDLTSHDTIEKINYCDLNKFNQFWINSFNIRAIVSIDGSAYSGVENVDYYFDGRQVYIGNLNSFASNKFGFFSLEYTTGFVVVPGDLVLLQCGMVIGEMNKKEGREVENYRIGDVSIAFSKDVTIDSPISIINRYKILNI